MTTAFDEAPLDFTTTEGLRLMLVRLRYRSDGWSHDPEASDLMSYAMEKYGALARKYGYEPVEAAIAAFDAMHTRAVRVAEDPWAVVTRAVELTLVYDQRADGLLCSNQQARREVDIERHDAERFSDREAEFVDFHPAFAIPAPQDAIDFDGRSSPEDDKETSRPTPGSRSTTQSPCSSRCAGPRKWRGRRSSTSAPGCCAQATASTAFEALRRDRHAQAMLDVDQRAWLVFLRVILGNQHPDRRQTSAGRGMLLRLVIGDHPEALLADRSLVAEIASIRQPVRIRTGRAATMSEHDGHIELERSVDSIVVGVRHRQHPEDGIEPLMMSIHKLGLLQPVTITPDGVLVCGARRLEAVKRLGWRTLKVWVRSGISDELSRLLAQQDENEQRKPLTHLEQAALFRELPELMTEDGARRQEASRFGADGEFGGGRTVPVPHRHRAVTAIVATRLQWRSPGRRPTHCWSRSPRSSGSPPIEASRRPFARSPRPSWRTSNVAVT